MSSKDLKKGDELFWQYGDTYWERKDEIEGEPEEESLPSIEVEEEEISSD